MFRSQSPHDTVAVGKALGEAFEGGEVLCLTGPLGAGKTCLAQGVALGLGVPEDAYVSSPSFVMVNQYQGRVPVYHVDLFRAGSGQEVEDLGLLEHLGGPAVTVIEWAEKAGHLLPSERIEVRLGICGEGTRELVCNLPGRLEAVGGRVADALRCLVQDKNRATGC